jgi:hypothetical protein
MNLYKLHSNPDELIRGEDKDRVLTNMVRDKLGYTTRFTPNLVTAVVDRLGVGWNDDGEPGESNLTEILNDIYQNGIDGGFSGFIYYSETKEFYLKNRKEINEFLIHESLDFGYDDDEDLRLKLDDDSIHIHKDEIGAISLVLSLRCADQSTTKEIYRTLYGDKSVCNTMVANCLAWYVVESLAMEYHNIMDG